jgi:hypothetical protein
VSSSPETAAESVSIALPPALALTSSMTLSTLLRQLPPSKEVLEFYHKKVVLLKPMNSKFEAVYIHT